MGTHDPAVVRISPTLTHGVTRRLSDDSYPRSVLEAQTSQHARSWPMSGPSKKPHTHAVPRIASQSGDYAAPGGDFSADSDGAAGAAGSSTLADSNAAMMMKPNNKRHRAEDTVESTIPAKRLRRCDADFQHVRDNMPNSSPPPSSSSSSANNITRASSSCLSKWQSPRTSPLGPKSSTYRRRSRMSPQPRRALNKVYPTTRWQCIMQNFLADIIARDPYTQSPQWCQDLMLTDLRETLHPEYKCLHLYHPDEPGYDAEWPEDSWSDEEWSDDEESEEPLTLSDKDHQQVQVEAQPETGAAQLRIIVPKEPSQVGSGSNATFTFMHWSTWGKRHSSKSTIFNSAFPWDAPESDSASTDEKGHHDHAFPKPIANAA